MLLKWDSISWLKTLVILTISFSGLSRIHSSPRWWIITTCKEYTENSMWYGYDENDNKTWAMRPSVRPTTVPTLSETTTRATCTSPERARRAHSFTLDVVSHLIGSSPESCLNHLHCHPWRTLFDSFLPFYFYLLFLSFPSTSSTPSCTLSSTTRSSWKACATPPTRGVRTPTTSPPPSH